MLTSDLKGDRESLERLLDARPDVLNHNVETVARLQHAVRPSAGYARSLTVLARAADAGLAVKSGLMVGLGETFDEVVVDARGPRRGRRAHRDRRPVPPAERGAPAGGALLGARGVRRDRRGGRPTRPRPRAGVAAHAVELPRARRARRLGARRAARRRAEPAARATARLRHARAWCAALAASAVLVGTAAVALAAGATGDGATIRLFRDVAANTNAQPAMQITQSGYMTESARVGSPSVLLVPLGVRGACRRASSAPPRRSPTPSIDGRVVWVTDVLDGSAPGCAAASGCPQPTPIELLITRVAAFAGLVDDPGGAVGCFVREPFTNVPYRAGGRWWTAIGDFRPMALRGNQALITADLRVVRRPPRRRARLDRPLDEPLHRVELPRGQRAAAGEAPFSFAQMRHRALLRAARAEGHALPLTART